MISIEVDDKAVIADLTGYSAKITRVAVRSLNRAIQSGKVAMTRDIARDTGLKVGDIKDALPVVQATRERLMAVFGAGLKRIPLIHFRARGPEPSRGRGRGVNYGLPGGRSRIPSAFIATMESTHRGVFVRSPNKFMRVQKPTWKKKRQAIVELYGPSLGYVFAKYRAAGLARTAEAFETYFDHELTRLTSQTPAGWAE